MPIQDLPEFSNTSQTIRIPPELDVPITDRVRAVLDTEAMQRLKRISQLGLVSMVYPGAVHSRFEHSLGVYRLACIVLKHLTQSQPDRVSCLTREDVKVFLLASLLHDVGHWPYCHPIEDMNLPKTQSHEETARRWIVGADLSRVLRDDWEVEPEEVADFLTAKSHLRGRRILQSVLNGPVDIDKMDYLQRDSVHAGVPYGRNFDVSRLIHSLRLGSGDAMTITSKGKTAAEMMVFSRYVMFSEVYWHHGVRSATAMLQRLVYRLQDRFNLADRSSMSDVDFQSTLLQLAESLPELEAIGSGLFGTKRLLYKRLGQYDVSTARDVHSAVAHRPFEQLILCAERLAEKLARHYQVEVGPNDVLIDAPPVQLEIQFRVNIEFDGHLVPLAEVSPVVRGLATDQFDQFVKMVRVFVAPNLRQRLRITEAELGEMLLESLL